MATKVNSMTETPDEKAHREKFRQALCEAVIAFNFWERGGSFTLAKTGQRSSFCDSDAPPRLRRINAGVS